MANHSRWCDKNPKRNSYKKSNKSNGSQLNTLEARAKAIEGIKKAHADGKYVKSQEARRGMPGRKHTEETKQLIREKALASPHRRLKKGTVMYKGVLLDSSWELELAKRLDELEIKWVRPDPIPWVDEEGVTHNYFPDFYLEDYGLFLDPKNPQTVKVQKKKLDCLLTQYKNIVIIESIEECKLFTPNMRP
jgi:hypothetical protein